VDAVYAPKEIVGADLKTRLDYFDTNYVYHYNFDNALNELLLVLRNAGKDTLIMLIGPASVGKSAISRAARAALLEDCRAVLEREPSRIASGYTELKSSNILLTWPEVNRTILRSHDEPLVDRKILPLKCLVEETSKNARASSDRFLYAVLSLLMHRKPLAEFLDNANFLNKIATSKPEWLLDPLMALCSLVPWVLIGAPTLLLLRNLNFQLGNRSHDIFLRSYKLTDSTDQRHFVDAVCNLQESLPLRKLPNLLEHADFLMEGCVGCVGLLKKWVRRALIVADSENAVTITLSHLVGTAPSAGNLKEAATEIAWFEERLIKLDEEERVSAFNTLYEVEGKWEEYRQTLVASGKAGEGAARKKKNGQVGVRKPSRDAVGIPPEFRKTS
jgi:hypothetical protein